MVNYLFLYLSVRLAKALLIKASERFARLIGIGKDAYQKLSQQPMNNEVWESLFKRITTVYKLNLKDFSSVTDMHDNATSYAARTDYIPSSSRQSIP